MAICIHLSRTFPGHVMKPHVFSFLGVSHASATHRALALCLFVWAMFPLVTFLLLHLVFLYLFRCEQYK